MWDLIFQLKGKLEEDALAVLERAKKRERKPCANDVIYLTARIVLHHVISRPMPIGDLHHELLYPHLRMLFRAFCHLYIFACFCGWFSFFVWFYVCSNFNFATRFFVSEAEIVHLLL